MVAYMKRYDAGNILVKKTMDELRASGAMGKLTFVRNHGFGGDWTAGLDVPRDRTDEPYPPAPNVEWPEWCGPKVRDGYLGYLQQYTHNVNLIRWLLKVEGALKVKAVDLNGCNGVVILDADGVRCTIESGWVPYEGWDEHTQIFFEKGWVKTGAPPLLLRNVPASVEVYHAEGDEKVASTHFPAGGRTWSYKMEMAHFVECVRGNKPFRSPAIDAMEDVRTLEHIYRECARQMA
jgi:predicted dehydrogenase